MTFSNKDGSAGEMPVKLAKYYCYVDFSVLLILVPLLVFLSIIVLIIIVI